MPFHIKVHAVQELHESDIMPSMTSIAISIVQSTDCHQDENFQQIVAALQGLPEDLRASQDL